jgi:hypothetical protein
MIPYSRCNVATKGSLVVAISAAVLLIPVTLCACLYYFLYDLMRRLTGERVVDYGNGYHWRYWASQFSLEEPSKSDAPPTPQPHSLSQAESVPLTSPLEDCQEPAEPFRWSFLRFRRDRDARIRKQSNEPNRWKIGSGRKVSLTIWPCRSGLNAEQQKKLKTKGII